MVAAAARRLTELVHASASKAHRDAHDPLRGERAACSLSGRGAARGGRPSMPTLVLIAAAAFAAVSIGASCVAAGAAEAPAAQVALRSGAPVRGAEKKTVAKKATKPAGTAKPAAIARPAAVTPTLSTRVAVVDTGVTPVGTVAPRLAGGADLVDSTGATTDGNGHGTAMATIAAGICTTCTFVPVRALNADGTGTTDVAAQGVRWAAANGARVINLSLTAGGADEGLTSAIEDAVAQGIVVVVAAGNSGSAVAGDQGYPGASAADAITVAAVDSAHQLASWSNHGSWVHLAAPGSLQSVGANGRAVLAIGTSASAAYVSGAAGLLLSCDPSLTPAEVRATLLGTAQPVPSLDGGLVEPQAALAAVGRNGCAH
jgi:subtilase family protein